MAERSKAWVCGRSLAGTAGSIPAGGGGWGENGCVSLVKVVCWQVDVFATSRSLAHSSPTECGVSIYGLGTPQQWNTLGPGKDVVPQDKCQRA